MLPYVLANVPLDQISMVEVSPFVVSLPQIVPPDFSSVPVWSPGAVLLKQVADEMVFHPRIPAGSVIAYERIGTGDIQIGQDTIRLTKRQHDPVLWKNL